VRAFCCVSDVELSFFMLTFYRKEDNRRFQGVSFILLLFLFFDSFLSLLNFIVYMRSFFYLLDQNRIMYISFLFYQPYYVSTDLRDGSGCLGVFFFRKGGGLFLICNTISVIYMCILDASGMRCFWRNPFYIFAICIAFSALDNSDICFLSLCLQR